MTTLPRNTKVKQVSFTRQRMFVVTQDGKLYVFRIDEKRGSRELEILSRKGPQFTGDL